MMLMDDGRCEYEIVCEPGMFLEVGEDSERGCAECDAEKCLTCEGQADFCTSCDES